MYIPFKQRWGNKEFLLFFFSLRRGKPLYFCKWSSFLYTCEYFYSTSYLSLFLCNFLKRISWQSSVATDVMDMVAKVLSLSIFHRYNYFIQEFYFTISSLRTATSGSDTGSLPDLSGSRIFCKLPLHQRMKITWCSWKSSFFHFYPSKPFYTNLRLLNKHIGLYFF